MLKVLTQTLNAICQPNPTQYPPASEDSKQLLHRNKISLFVLFALLLTPIFFQAFFFFSPSFNTTRMEALFVMLIIFIATCRSHRTIGLVLITTLCQSTSILLIFRPDGVYYQLSTAHATPIFQFLVTSNLYVSATSAFSHIILLQIKLKQNILNALLSTDPEVFVDKLVLAFLVSFVTIETICIITFATLDKRTSQLSRATKAAKDALEQQKTFIYSFSHEMRNPMNSLLGNLDLVLMNNSLPGDIRHMLNTARTCGVLLLNHINTVLDAGKMDLATLEVKPTQTKVHDVSQRIWMISHDLIAQKGLKYHLKIEKKVPPLLMLDSHRLSQILLNLIGNATKFTQRGSIGITVQWTNSTILNDECFEPKPYDEEDEGIFEKDENISFCRMNSFGREPLEYLVLSHRHKEFDLQGVTELEKETPGILKIVIKDTGCGISNEEIPKLFQKFSQVGNDTYQKSMGTGLGLYISKEICKNMNGDIRVYSKLKVGTTFIICIPATALPTHQHTHLATDSARIIEALKAKKLRVIVADDSPFNVNLVSNFCYKFGAKVIAATFNGLNAYEKYVQSVKRGIPVDLVTLDIDMPVMDGKEACEKIRQYERENNLKPAIIMLISGNYETQQVASSIGDSQNRKADSFMRKPLVFSEFYWNVYKLVHNV